jgi:putative ATP-binding cassette transporter
MLLSGVGNGALIALANLGAASAEITAARGLLLALYIGALAVYTAGLRRGLIIGFVASEQALERVRTRLTTRLLQADLAYVERHAETGRFTPLTQDTRLVADAITQALYCLQMMGVFAVSSVYMALKDPATFALVGAVFIGVLPLLIRNYRQATQDTLRSSESENGFIALFGEIVSGFKEVKLNRSRGEAIQKDLTAQARRAQLPRQKVNQSTVDGLQFSSGIFYLLIAVLVFVLPEIWPSHDDTVAQTLSTVLFLMGPLTMLSTTLPMLARAEATVVGLYALEGEIGANSHGATSSSPVASTSPNPFGELAIRSVRFRYTDASGAVTFECGPIDLRLNRGDLVFVIGGNGSGKSTLLKLLTGLYEPLAGERLLDGRRVDAALLEQWRELFAIVFTDFHLFDRLYGMEHVDPTEVQRWLQVMGLAHKTRYSDGRFTQTSLSTGQRKRLAFIVTVLRNKPICVFDEVAADQDPDFRRRFYRELLPELRARGTTIIVVSHDDAYFDCADRLIRLQDGRIVA